MKRLTSLILALVCVFSLVSCGTGTETETVTPEAPENATPSEPAAGIDYAPDTGCADLSAYPNLDSIAAYKKTDWQAEWIWTKGCSEDSYVIFRKTFTLDKAESATAYISSVDKYVLWVNGALTVLDGSVKRGPTPYDTYYDTVEINNLRAGENIIAILVAFNGRSGDGSIVPVLTNDEGDENTQAGLLFEMTAGGVIVKSDSTWKALRHPAYKNRVTGGADYIRYDQSSMLAERNVWFDARDDAGDFTALSFDDSAWESARLIAKPGQKPFGDLYDAIQKPVYFGTLTDFENSADYVGKTLTEDTVLELRLPGNIQFTWYVELEAAGGERLTFCTDTYTDRQGNANFKDTYIAAAGAQQYENYPWRSGMTLYIEAPAGVRFTRLAYRESGYNGEKTGSFTSSDAALTQLWQESVNTVAICLRDSFMDCPDRERGPYMGDASNQIDALLYGYGEGSFEIVKKAVLNCVTWTKEDGAIPSRAPSVKPQEIPNQSLIFSSAVYHYWLSSGDKETVSAYYKAFVKYLALYEMGENGLPVYRDGSWTWNDWGKKIDIELLQVGIYYYALQTAEKLGAELGIDDGVDMIRERMASIEANFREAYYTPEGFKSEDSACVDDRANAMLALAGLVSGEDAELVASILATTYEASPFTEKYVLEALCLLGRTDAALQRIRDRYAPMLTDKWDTLWEEFNDDTGTYNHGWTAAPAYILSKYAAGVRPTKAGWAEYEIVPTDALESYSCTVWTPKGNITVLKNGAALTVTAIDGGTLLLPNGETVALTAGEHSFTMEKGK